MKEVAKMEANGDRDNRVIGKRYFENIQYLVYMYKFVKLFEKIGDHKLRRDLRTC